MSNFEEIDDLCFSALNDYQAEPSQHIKAALKKKVFYKNLVQSLWFRLSVFVSAVAVITALFFVTNNTTPVKLSSATNDNPATGRKNECTPKSPIFWNDGKMDYWESPLFQHSIIPIFEEITFRSRLKNINNANNNIAATNIQQAKPGKNNKPVITNTPSEKEIHGTKKIDNPALTASNEASPVTNKNEESKNTVLPSANTEAVENPATNNTNPVTEKLAHVSFRPFMPFVLSNPQEMSDTAGRDYKGDPIVFQTNAWRIGVGYSPFISMFNYKAKGTENSAYASVLNKGAENTPGHSLSISASWTHERWFVETGLSLTWMKNKIKMPYLLDNPRMQNNLVYNGAPYDFTHNGNYYDIDSTGYYHYFWAQDSMIHVIDSVWEYNQDTVQVNIYDTTHVHVYDTLKNKYIETNYFYAEVPLLIGFEISGRRAGFFIKGGIISGYLVSVSGMVNNSENPYIAESTNHESVSNFLFSAYLGGGLLYHFNEHLKLTAEPYYRRSLISISKNKAVSDNHTIWGVKFGIVYEF